MVALKARFDFEGLDCEWWNKDFSDITKALKMQYLVVFSFRMPLYNFKATCKADKKEKSLIHINSLWFRGATDVELETEITEAIIDSIFHNKSFAKLLAQVLPAVTEVFQPQV